MLVQPFTVRTATRTELDHVIELCLSAFADEAVTAWVVPDPVIRQREMRRLFASSLGAAIDAEALLLAISPEGTPIAASLWVPFVEGAGEHPTSAPTGEDSQTISRMAVVESATRVRRPKASHLYLSSMGTLPSQRGRGAGTVLLSAGRERARALGLPIYLEASTVNNRRLYERFGFRDLGAPIHLPDGGPSLQPMCLENA